MAKEVPFLYGSSVLKIDLPDRTEVIQTRDMQACSDEPTAILLALMNPIDSPPLSALVNADSRVLITHSDITRATPNKRILPVIIKELMDNGVQKSNITLLNALGTHRQQTDAELEEMLGSEIFNNFVCEQHNANNDALLVSIGKTSNGNPIRINRRLLEADLKIFTGFIEPHFFAGFSGGPKAVMPALAGSESVFSNHGYKMIAHPKASFNITEGNPIWEEMREIAGRIENTFLVNVTLSKDHRITNVFAGDVISAHKAGCDYLREYVLVDIDEAFDIVITSNSGYPLDQNLYQCVKGLSAAGRAVRNGGAILLVAECRDGLPGHGSYAELLRAGKSPENILRMISQPGFTCQDSWQVQVQANIQQHADVYVYSDGLSDLQIREALFLPCRNIADALEKMTKQYGERICAIPEGPLVIVNEPSNTNRQ